LPVAVLCKGLRQGFKLAGINKSVTPGNFLRAGDLEALPVFQRGDELAGIEQAFVRAGIQPGIAALEDLHIKLALLQIGLVDRGDFQLATRTGFDRFSDIDHLIIVEIEAGDGVIALWLDGLFLDADGFTSLVELNHAVALGVLHMIGKHGTAGRLLVCLSKQDGKIMPVENVIAQHQCARRIADELFTDNERLRQPVRAGLDSIFQMNAPLRTIAQQLLKTRQIARRADNQNLAYACQHQRAKRVVDHRLVVDRQQLLAECQRSWMQTGAGTAGEYDAFSREW